MTFLQPFILWGIPLALLPLIIHLLNRMRYRTTRWAAMSFLFSANRASTRYAKLRQFLILACRVLALLALILAVARPLAGGWIGWMVSPAPDVVLVLLDRSASMETKDATNTFTRRELALRSLASAAEIYANRVRFVLIESALRKPQEIASPKLLPQLAMTAPTDTAADIPAMLDTAADWLSRNKTGLSEIWIASDLQRTNWQPESNRWPSLATRLAALPQGVRVRLLALTRPSAPNVSVSINDLTRRQRAGQPQLDLTLDLERTDTTPTTLPVTITLNDVRSNFQVALNGQSLRVHRALTLDPTRGESGWGKVEIPADAGLRDNTGYFVYGPKLALRAALVASDEPTRRCLQFAAAPSPKSLQQTCEVISNPEGADWQKYALVLWQSPLPTGAAAERLQAFVNGGGVVVFFPPGTANANSFAGASWGVVQTAESEQAFRISRWDEQDGPLANSEEGLTLPVAGLASHQRQQIISGGDPRGSFADEPPFLAERALGAGRVLFCATLPNPAWSNLGDGRVLVPMLQRLLERGGKRFEASTSFLAGDPAMMENAFGWSSVEASGKAKDIRIEAGVYRNGARLVAINRPPNEDEPDLVESTSVKQLFGRVPFQFFEEPSAGEHPPQSEVWRTLLGAMLAFMVIEALLSLPSKTAQPIPSEHGKAKRAEFAGAGLP